MTHNIFSTIASRNTREAYNFLADNGYSKLKKDPQIVALALADYVLKHKDNAHKVLADLHPDKELFENININPEPEPLQPIISNCDGCQIKNADGKETNTSGKKFKLSEKNINVLIISGALIFTITSLVILIKKAK